MEILSFVLGMSAVVVIVVSIVAVIGFVKARKIEKETNRIHTIMGNESERVTRDIADTHQRIDDRVSDIYRAVSQLENNVFSQLDSRLDKLENKLITKK